MHSNESKLPSDEMFQMMDDLELVAKSQINSTLKAVSYEDHDVLIHSV